MLSCTIAVVGTAPFSPSKPLAEQPKLKNETEGEREARIWRERIWHKDGHVFIPAMMFKKAIDGAGNLTKRRVKGSGNQTYAQHFKSGIIIQDPVMLYHPGKKHPDTKQPVPILKDEVPGIDVFCSAQGDSRGVGKRVIRTYGLVQLWMGTLNVHIANEAITPQIFEDYFAEAGLLIGVGRWRPANGGGNGRFKAQKFEWGERDIFAQAA